MSSSLKLSFDFYIVFDTWLLRLFELNTYHFRHTNTRLMMKWLKKYVCRLFILFLIPIVNTILQCTLNQININNFFHLCFICYSMYQMLTFVFYCLDNWRPPSLSDLTPMTFNMGLTHSGSEDFNSTRMLPRLIEWTQL